MNILMSEWRNEKGACTVQKIASAVAVSANAFQPILWQVKLLTFELPFKGSISLEELS